MNSLSPARTEALEARLRTQRAALITRIREQLHRSDDPRYMALANHLETAGDWAGADALAENDIALIRHDLAELEEIDAALKRVAAHSYGVCTDCGNDIDPRRLDAQPAARYCVACGEAVEKKHALAGKISI